MKIELTKQQIEKLYLNNYLEIEEKNKDYVIIYCDDDDTYILAEPVKDSWEVKLIQ